MRLARSAMEFHWLACVPHPDNLVGCYTDKAQRDDKPVFSDGLPCTGEGGKLGGSLKGISRLAMVYHVLEKKGGKLGGSLKGISH